MKRPISKDYVLCDFIWIAFYPNEIQMCFFGHTRGSQDLSFHPPGIEPVPPALEAQSPKPWTGRELPYVKFLEWLNYTNDEHISVWQRLRLGVGGVEVGVSMKGDLWDAWVHGRVLHEHWLHRCQYPDCDTVAETSTWETKHHTQRVGKLRFIMPEGPEGLILQALSPEQRD